MLIDIGLTDMDGYQLVQQLAKLPSGKGVHKIALMVTDSLTTSSVRLMPGLTNIW